MTTSSLHGRTCLVTGATSGVGEATALAMARAGARVILGCRTWARGEEVRRRLQARCPEAALELMAADLSDLRAVRAAASDVLSKNERIDVLINNAGVYHPGERRSSSQDGLEMTFAVNHLAHFLLTRMLLERLSASPSARVITVASEGYRDVELDFTDLQSEQCYDGDRAYDRSKRANVLFTQELARRMAGTGVTALCLHPGEFSTELFRHCTWYRRLFLRWTSRSPARMEGPMMRLICDPAAKELSGTYHVDDTMENLMTRDPAPARRLWQISETILGAICAIPGLPVASPPVVEDEGMGRR